MIEKLVISLVIVSLVLVVSGCVQQGSGPVCNPPYIVKGFECCLDRNDNNICDEDEQQFPACGDGECQANEDCFSCPQDCGECETSEYCGDSICSPEENVCEYDTDSDRYESKCPDDCGHKCPGKIVLSSNVSKSEETHAYNCSGFREGICINTGNNEFMIEHATTPYESLQRGIRTAVKNVGEDKARIINSSFECYAENRTVMDSDGDIYKDISVEDYFYYDGKKESIDVLNPVYPEGTDWYLYHYLDLEVRYMEKEFDLTCNISLTSQDPAWEKTQTVYISFVK